MRSLRRVGLLALCSVLSGAGETPRAEAEAGKPPAPASVLTIPNMVLSNDSPEAKAIAAFAANRPQDARYIVQLALSKATEPSLGRLRWLYARTSQDIADVRIPLEALAKSSHPLALWAQLRLAERLRDRDPDAAVLAAETLQMEPAFRERAEQLLALALYAANRTQEAEPILRALLAETPEKSAAASWALPLANILAAKPDAASQRQALALCRRVMTRAPLSNSADQARQLAAKILERFSAAERKALAPLGADDAFTEAQSLLDTREYRRAANAYAALGQRFAGDPKSLCDAQLGQAKALGAAKRPEALGQFQQVARTCRGGDARGTALFQAGRLLLRRGEPTSAIAHYEALAHEFPKHKLVDDALLAAATAYQDLGDHVAARSRLEQLLTIAPYGDRRPDARFMLAWIERTDGDYEAAFQQLTKLLAEGPEERSEDIVGRAAYWRARTLLDQRELSAAKSAFSQLIATHPLRYYGQQALARLNEIDRDSATQLVSSLRADSAGVSTRLAARPEMKSGEFERAIELMRVGEPSLALEELEALGCFRPTADDDLYLLAAAILQEFGAEGQATTLARRRVAKVLNRAPKGTALALWRVVFPRAYRPLIDDVARQFGLPAAFVRAIAREESSFDANAVSPANAYGLIQLIRPTAKAFGKPLGLPSDPASLKKPEINLRIGANFMRSLFERYNQNSALVPAAYNAGPGAADRWLRERGDLDLDEWIETIPYAETRRYTRRVLQSYGVYSWLDEGRIPPLVKRLPRKEPAPTNPTDPISVSPLPAKGAMETASASAPETGAN